jgi:cyanophycinase
MRPMEQGQGQEPKRGQGPGALVIVGGGEDRPGEILETFVRLAGGDRARVVVMTAASDAPVDLERQYCEAFRQLGAAEISCLRTAHRHDAESPGVVEAIERATAVFLTGGSQQNLIDRLRGTPAHEALRRRHVEGLVIGGTSAGASAMSETMLVSGTSEDDPYAGCAELGPGLSLLPGAIVDQHFTQRGRIGSLLSALAERPDLVGLGIAEDTALVVSGRRFDVIGSGSVTVLDAASLSHCRRVTHHKKEALALCGVLLHSLPTGLRVRS